MTLDEIRALCDAAKRPPISGHWDEGYLTHTLATELRAAVVRLNETLRALEEP